MPLATFSPKSVSCAGLALAAVGGGGSRSKIFWMLSRMPEMSSLISFINSLKDLRSLLTCPYHAPDFQTKVTTAMRSKYETGFLSNASTLKV